MLVADMTFPESFLAHYGWQGAALAAVMLVLLCTQLYYYLFAYGRIPAYKNNRRKAVIDAEPPISVIVPMFSEDYTFVENQLPWLLRQEYAEFEIVIVYVGCDGDFFEDLLRIRQSFPRVVTTKIEQDNRFPISTKMALNVGIKSSHFDHLIITSTDARPRSNRWLALMAKGFMRGEIVVGYCGMERKKGFANRWIRTDRMMESVQWLARAVAGAPYRGIRHNVGFVKRLYFEAKGFNHLNMNLGEDDLFLQQIIHGDNVSVVLSPRAATEESVWGGLGWWTRQQRYFGVTRRFYPAGIRNFIQWELGSRVLFFAAAATAVAVMPAEYKLAAAALILLRYIAVFVTIWRIARRLGERGLCGTYFLHDLLSPFYELFLALLRLRRNDRVWR